MREDLRFAHLFTICPSIFQPELEQMLSVPNVDISAVNAQVIPWLTVAAACTVSGKHGCT